MSEETPPGEGIKLVRFRKVEFGREDEDVLSARLLDEKGNPVVTFDPRLIEVGKTYVIDFRHDLVTATQEFTGLTLGFGE